MRLLALAFSSVTPGPRNTQGIKRAYEHFVALFAKAGLNPTHFAFGDPENEASGKFRKWDSPAHKRGLQADFENVDMVSVIASPPEAEFLADEAMLNLAYTFPRISDEVDEADVEAELVLVAEEPVWLRIREVYPEIVENLASLSRWDFGYGQIADRAEAPAAHIMCIGNGRQGNEESRRLDAWYNASKEDRRTRLRDVYAYNFLNPKQLAFELPAGRALRDYIAAEPASKLTSITPYLDLWEVAPDAVQRVRQELLGTGVLIAE